MDLSSAFLKIERQLATWSGWPLMKKILDLHPSLNVYVAGGAIRNLLMGLPDQSKDWDFFFAGNDLKSAISSLKIQGRLTETPYGAPRWFPSNTDNRYADLIPIGEFIPGLWKCEDITDVLNQFDFTANAIAFDLRTGSAFNPQNGARDAKRRIMRMVRFDYPNGPYRTGAALDRNVVLWFRIIHYASHLHLQIEPLTKGWLLQHANAIQFIQEFEREFYTPSMQSWNDLNA